MNDFGIYSATILSKKKIKIFIVYIQIINIVLLYTIFMSIGAYSSDFLLIVQFGVFWSIFPRTFHEEKIYKYLNNIDMVLLRTRYRYI